MRIPRVPFTLRIPPGNARWAALAGGVVILSVAIAVIVGTFGLFGFSTGESAGGRQVTAKVIIARSCDPSGAMETVSFTLDGRQRQAILDGCGHREGESVQITVPPGAGTGVVVRAADATTGSADSGRDLRLLLLVLASTASAAYPLLFHRDPKSLLGPLRPVDLGKLRFRRGRRSGHVG